MTAPPPRFFRQLQALASQARWWLLPCAFGLLLPLLNRVLPPSADRLPWLLDLAAHWQCIYALTWIALCLLCTVRSRRWLVLLPLALLPLYTATAPLPQADTNEPALIVVTANVHLGNRDPAPLVTWLRAQPADIVILSELTPAYADVLSTQLGDDYPHRILLPEQSPFGIGMVSRWPLDDVRSSIDDDRVQLLSARMRFHDRPARIVAAHPMPPLTPEWHGKRDALLQLIAETSDTPLVLAGDLNATPWSSAFIAAKRAGLFRATGLLPTWPSRHIGIPIDHVLASSHWHRSAYTRGPEIGSDHLPVRVALHWADANHLR